MNSKKKRDTTQIVFERETEMFFCVKCKAVMEYNFGFRYCPYCRRKVTANDSRFKIPYRDVKLSYSV